VPDWLVVVLGVGILAITFAEIAGPFALEDDERPARSSRTEIVRAWLRGWPRRPRDPLTPREWFPHNGRLFLPAYACPLLLVGGARVLTRSGETFRLGGLFAVAGGLLLLVVIVVYVRRPVRVVTADEALPKNSGTPSTVPPSLPPTPTSFLPPKD
jgi:hypothetical protein